MKALLSLLSIFLVFAAFSCSSPKEAQSADGTHMKNVLEAKHYSFQAQLAQPTRGASRQLTSGYELRVAGDTLIAQLPYFGRAYQAPSDLRGGGVEFTSVNYSYTIDPLRKGRWNITLVPRDQSDVRQMTLSVSQDGYASLQVLSTNRDPISFSGVVVEKSSGR